MVGVSTKWQLLDRLVPLMHAQRQRALILSQSPKSLDLVEVQCTRPLCGCMCCRLRLCPCLRTEADIPTPESFIIQDRVSLLEASCMPSHFFLAS